MQALRLLALFFTIASSEGCWYQSKDGAVKQIERFLKTSVPFPELGVTAKQLGSVMVHAPFAVQWAIERVGAVAGVLRDCDLDGNGIITIDEIYAAETCLDACWKQTAVTLFLPGSSES